ncbi:hypothetical protein BCV70DRAFT_92018 [Testicularia cyperi]|uniref:Uncharacterized protein n=1 Tax=Testicularia cyperi TaxID=1882483 RepID=A0A317XI82_9BASI|nr:hypothetical protein BCV70DRAFT_92018 [Testicularia cyperi]
MRKMGLPRVKDDRQTTVARLAGTVGRLQFQLSKVLLESGCMKQGTSAHCIAHGRQTKELAHRWVVTVLQYFLLVTGGPRRSAEGWEYRHGSDSRTDTVTSAIIHVQ